MAEHCRGTPIILCGFHVTEHALKMKQKTNTKENKNVRHIVVVDIKLTRVVIFSIILQCVWFILVVFIFLFVMSVPMYYAAGGGVHS